MITVETSKNSPFYERITVNPFTRIQKDFLKTDSLTGHRVKEKQDELVKKLEDGITDIYHILEQPKNVEHERDDINQIFNPMTLHPIIHNLIRNFPNENEPSTFLSKYKYDFRRMEIVRMLFDELSDYIIRSPMFQIDIHVFQNLDQISLKLKNSSETILKDNNLLIKQIKSELNKKITKDEIEKVRRELKEQRIQEKEKKPEKKLSEEDKDEIKIPEKQITDILIKQKFESLLLELNSLDIKLSEYSSNAREQNIKLLYFDLYELDIEYNELRKLLTKNEISKNREKRKQVLKRIKNYREQDKILKTIIEKINLTENEFDKIIERVKPYFSPLNPINKFQIISDSFHKEIK